MIRDVPRARARGLSAVVFLLGAAVGGCGSDETLPNQAPTVEITSGPVDGGTASYSILISWSGNDPDGFVARFEYAVDPPSGFTEEEIAGRVTEGITEETIPGEGGAATVTRVSKTVGGETVSFDWVHTPEFSRHFRFATPEADSMVDNGRLVPTGRFTGMHAVYVRAVDDGGLRSAPDKVAFTAETVAPESEIVRPDISSYSMRVGPHLRVGWRGEDPDGPGPVGFLYSIIEPPGIICTLCDPRHWLLISEWTFLDAETAEISPDLEIGKSYFLGLRAVDEAGAVEPFLEFGRNAFGFYVLDEVGPEISVSYDGQVFSSATGDGIFQTEVVSNRDLVCTIGCSAESYGEQCEGWRWAVDIADLEEGPWSEWTLDPTIALRFDRPGIHVLYVQGRDTLGNTTQLTLVMNALELTLDRDLLYVDDSYDDLFPGDAEHDAFWRQRIQDYGGFLPEGVGEFHAHLDNDRGALSPRVPQLEELGRYRIVLWECRGSGYNGATSLLKASALKPTLSAYLGAGGKLWLGGRMTVAATMLDASGQRVDLRYPKTDEQLKAGNFAYDFMKIHSTLVNNDKAGNQTGRNNIYKALPYPGRPEIYPEMTVDLDKMNLAARQYGVSHADAVFDPIFAHSEPGFRGIIDSLYVYGSTGVHLLDPPSSSAYEGRLTALRWHDPDPAREHGRIQWFGFPMYFMFDDQAQETFNRSMDWFREEEPTAGRVGGTYP